MRAGVTRPGAIMKSSASERDHPFGADVVIRLVGAIGLLVGVAGDLALVLADDDIAFEVELERLLSAVALRAIFVDGCALPSLSSLRHIITLSAEMSDDAKLGRGCDDVHTADDNPCFLAIGDRKAAILKSGPPFLREDSRDTLGIRQERKTRRLICFRRAGARAAWNGGIGQRLEVRRRLRFTKRAVRIGNWNGIDRRLGVHRRREKNSIGGLRIDFDGRR